VIHYNVWAEMIFEPVPWNKGAGEGKGNGMRDRDSGGYRGREMEVMDLVFGERGNFSPCEDISCCSLLKLQRVWWERSRDEDIMSCISLPLPEQVPDLVRCKFSPCEDVFLDALCLRWWCGEEGREWIRI
jgi:hypothetical protein